MTMLRQFPFGFYFDAEDGRYLDVFDVWRLHDGTIGWYDGATFREARRAEPWELL
jgi:hypothetical protein